jgi:sugar-specific transcriptional regulator TrmB
MSDSNTTPTENDAISALQRLGLSKYEAAVFIALQKLGTGTASEVDRITDVPRSQVYGAADRLEELGLVEVQQSTPIQYRSIGLDEARERLRMRLDEEERHAFEYLETVRGECADDEETQVDVWTVQGVETINNRVVDLAGQATDRIFFGADDESMLDDAIVDTLTSAPASVDVSIVSENPAVCERFDTDNVTTHVLDEDPVSAIEDRSGRVLVVDSDTVLLSILAGDELPELNREAAIWSAGTGFAVVFIGLLDGWFGQYLDE